PQCEDDEQAEEWADRGPEDAASQNEEPDYVDHQRTHDEQPIGAIGDLREPSIDARRQLVEAITQTAFREATRADEGLGPEPQTQRRRDSGDAESEHSQPGRAPRRERLFVVHGSSSRGSAATSDSGFRIPDSRFPISET